MNKKSRQLTVALAGLATLVAANAAHAVPLFSIGGIMGQGPLFDSGTGDVTLNVGLSSMSLSEPFFFPSPFSIANGATLSLTGSALSADTSAGGLASATFQSGGTMTITGDLLQNGNPFATGVVLLTGTMSGFTLQEKISQENNVDLDGGVFFPSGGAMFDEGLTPTPFTFDTSFIGAQNQIGGIEDFQSDVTFFQESVFSMFETVPEPSTAIMFGSMCLGVMLRRRRA
ncbi:MAG: hypothetical protein DHS20C16_09430 [Phycisphaerae bacterium]|nr:MAG: hypothetical protein DHS20C16_09430 [Phycisphaerae bacterium]